MTLISETDITSALARGETHGMSTDFDLNNGIKPNAKSLRPAAVLVPIKLGRQELLLTRRDPRLKHHPGQIAFPGGKVDPTDASAEAAALREAEEEAGLPQSDVMLLGALPKHITITGFEVTPFIGIIPDDFVPIPEQNEVTEAFTIPLAHVLHSDNFIAEGRVFAGQKRFYYTVPYGPYYIWGATARMLRMFADLMEGRNAVR